MYIEYTAEEQKKLQEIIDNYAPERQQLSKALSEIGTAPENEEERRKLITQQQSVMDQLQAEVDAYMDKIQRKRFKSIKEAGAEAILAHAKEQMPIILKLIHEDAQRNYKNVNAKALKELQLGTKKNGELYVNANFANLYLKDELRLHLKALQDNKPALQDLLEAIIEAIETSPYTDNEEIVDKTEKAVNLMRYRRNPLKDISMFGILNDQVNARLLQDEDSIFKQKADGQLTLTWAANQAAKNKEAVPVYMALTYEGNDYKVTKKLTSYDKQVYEAVATRFYYWNKENPQAPLYITPQEIWRTMNGKRSGDSKVSNPSKKQVQRICDSLDKMRFTRFYMDIREEIKAFNLSIDDERIISGRIETYVLNSSKIEFTTDKGNTVQGYRIGEEPILYSYNKAKKHILYVPYEMLDTSQYTSDSENVAEFKGYLLQQIQLMKNAAEQGKKGNFFKRNSIILLETIYRDTGIQPPEERIEGKDYKTEASKQKEIRRFRQADRQKIEGILDAWKAKGWIKGYTVLNAKNEPLKEKQQAKGYSISI